MNVILSSKEFDKMVKEIQTLRDEKEELQKANDFLNKQIKEYNERFGGKNG